MPNISIATSTSVVGAADLRRRAVHRRIKASEHTIDLLANLAFPPNPDRDDRRVASSAMVEQVGAPS